MYLFILESIGTSELILIGIVALMIFGPRKLPQMARTIGKTMADFRKTTNEFKTTWEKEVESVETELQIKDIKSELNPAENSFEAENKKIAAPNSILSPEIKEISSDEAEKMLALKEENKVDEPRNEESRLEVNENDKRSWL
jgi:Tat protein translocase TatB subunit